MKKLIVSAIMLLTATAAYSQDAMSVLKTQIGDLVISNANLSGQLNAVQVENAKIKAELDKLKPEQKPAEQKPADK